MRKTKTLLKKAIPEVAQRRRECGNTRRKIHPGETCLVVFDGPRQRYCYSREVALRMIAEARRQLDDLESAL
jgi:hypothetical protein